MRWLILMLAGAFILTGCSNTDEPPIDEPETSEADTEESVTEETETTETADEEDAESEEESDENASVNTENISETEEAEEAAEPVDVMEDTELVSGYWINYSGEDDARSYMTRTEPMEYIPEQDYTVTAAAYVSYFYGSEFIKTNNYGHDGPHIIEQVPEADRIIVSFNEPEKDTVQLINEGRKTPQRVMKSILLLMIWSDAVNRWKKECRVQSCLGRIFCQGMMYLPVNESMTKVTSLKMLIIM